MNATLIKHEFYWNGNEDDFDENSIKSNGELVLYFSNGVILETCVFYDKWNGIFLRSPYREGEVYAGLYLKYPAKQITSFLMTKSYSNIFKNGAFVKKFTKLKYWIYIRSKHNERKQIRESLSRMIDGCH